MNVWILCNEDAGRGFSADNLCLLIEGAGHTVISVAKQYDEHSQLPDGHLDLVVAAGGDGTVATVAGIAAKTAATLAILPLGTANNIATSLGVKKPVPELIASWPHARRMPFDLGVARAASKEWLVVEGVGGGLVPAGIARVQAIRERDEQSAPSAAVADAVRIFRDTLADLEPREWRFSIDGRDMTDALLLVEVLNIRSIGPNIVLGPDASSSDGYFDVVMAREADRPELETYFEQRAVGRDTRLALPRHRARHVSIASCAELHIDDERVDTCAFGPISIEMKPAAISVLV